ncbi:MAG: yycF [Bryobacterales bacterium]|nr:yycF [Bryobacterales bacterium]
MGLPGFSKDAVRFGVFEVDLASAELRKHGAKLRLQEQPFQVLAALLERPGEVVKREDLIRRLWADGTVVDFDRGLNAAVTRLRQALSDPADVPRYVETVARRGYRFIGPVERAGEEARRPEPLPVPMPSRRGRTWAVAILISVIAPSAGWWLWTRAHTSRSESALKVVPLTTGTGVERNPSFSPDGSQIVYEWEQDDGKRHIYMKVVGPGDPIRLTSGEAAEYGPVWSPDGRLIAFLRQLDKSTMGVFVVPPLGGVEEEVARNPSLGYYVLRQFHRRLDWTRDSRHLIVSAPEQAGGTEGLFLVSVADGENGEKTWLTKPSSDSTFGDREPAVSPDGRMVAFSRGQPGTSEVVHLMPLSSDLRPAGAPRPLASAGHSENPVWTSDGKQIIYSKLNPGITSGSMWTIGLKTGDVPRPLLALGRNAAVPAMARTGSLAYSQIRFEGNIWRQEIPTRPGAIPPPERLIASSALDFNGQYSPDGSRIAFASNRSGNREIWTCASDGTHCVQVTPFNATFTTGSPRWSPDGKQLVFDSGAAGQLDVYVLDAKGGSPRRLTADATHGFSPSWSHDGKRIYFSSSDAGRNAIWKIPSDGGKAVQVTRNGGFVAFESPDGKALYYTKTDQDAKLWRSTEDGSGETEVLSGVANRGFVVAADRVYYLRQESDGSTGIRRFILATGEDSQIVSVAKPMFLGLSMSPGGKYLIYSQMRVGSNLMLVEDFH